MATAAQLKALRKKHGIGEFKKKAAPISSEPKKRRKRRRAPTGTTSTRGLNSFLDFFMPEEHVDFSLNAIRFSSLNQPPLIND